MSVVAVAVVVLVAADEDVVAVIEQPYEKPELKDPGANTCFQVIRETWKDKSVLNGSLISTQRGENSSVDLRIKDNGGSWIRVKRKSLIRLLRKGVLYYGDVTKGDFEVRAAGGFILRNKVAQVEATRGTVYEASFTEEGSVALTVKRGSVLLVTKQGVRFQMRDGARAKLEFDPSRGRLSLVVSDKSEAPVIAVGKWERKEVLPGYAVGFRGGELLDIRRSTPREKARPYLKMKCFVGFAGVMRGSYFEDDNTYGYYVGGLDDFDILKAEAHIVGRYHNHARFKLALDGSTSKPTNEAWVEFLLDPMQNWEDEHLAVIRVGQMRLPFGLNVGVPREELALPFYPFIVRYGFCGLQTRMPEDKIFAKPEDAANLDMLFDLGVMVYGRPIVGMRRATGFDVRYAAGVFNGAGRNAQEENHRKLFCGKVEFAWWRLTLGGSYYDGGTGRHAEELHRRRRGAYIRLDLSWLVLSGEYIYAVDDPRVGKDHNDSEGFCVEADFGLGALWKKAGDLHFILRWERLLPAPKSMPSLAPGKVPDVTVVALGLRWNIKKWIALVAAWEKIDQGSQRYPGGLEPEEANETFHLFLVVNIADFCEIESK